MKARERKISASEINRKFIDFFQSKYFGKYIKYKWVQN